MTVPPPSRWTLAWVGPLTFLVHALGAQPANVGMSCDDAIYVQLGRALAETGGFSVAGLPGAPELAKYPPGWPVILAGFEVAGLPLRAVLLFNALVWAAVAQGVVSVLLPRLGASVGVRLAVGALLAVNTVTMQIAPTAMSEAPFTLALLGAVVLATGPLSRGRMVALAMVTASAGLLRSIGGPLALLAAAVAAVRGQRAAAVALATGWLVQAGIVRAVRATISPPTGDSWTLLHYYAAYDEHTAFYTDPLAAGGYAEVAGRVVSVATTNTVLGLRSLSGLLIPGDYLGGEGPSMSNASVGAGLLALAAVGVLRVRALRPIGLLLATYIAIFVLWTWPFSVRFWLPIWPFLAVAAVMGLAELGNVGRLLMPALVAMAVIGNSFWPWYQSRSLIEHGLPPERVAPDPAVADWIRPGDIVLSNLAALHLGASLGVLALELEALLPSERRLRLALQLTDPRIAAPDLAEALTPGLDATLRSLPVGGHAWVVVTAGSARRMVPAIDVLVEGRRLALRVSTPSVRVWEVLPTSM